VALTLDHLQQREEHWAIVDLVGKGGHIRTVPIPDWVRAELDDWLAAAGIDRGRRFRRVNKVVRTWGDGMTVKAVWHIVKESARSIGWQSGRRTICDAMPNPGYHCLGPVCKRRGRFRREMLHLWGSRVRAALSGFTPKFRSTCF